MNTRLFSTALLMACAVLAAVPVLADPPRPNIVYIMTDDHAYHALSCYGSKINQTPHLDRIAKSGVRFQNAFVTNSICTPSRATLLTGKYSHMNGTPVFNRFDGEQQTVAKLLQQSGYHTVMVGKWHLGSNPTGFDSWNILPGQGRYMDPVLYDAKGARVYEGYATDVITDIGIQSIKARPKDKPFFLMLHHKAPHREWLPDPKNRELFANKVIPEPATLRDDYATRPAALPENRQTVFRDLTRFDLKLPPLKPNERPPQDKESPQNRVSQVEITVNGVQKVLKGAELDSWKYQRYMQDYLACVQGVDDNVGRFLDWLKAEGLDQNTIVIYTSDNGFFLGDNGMYDKRFMYEPSLHIPLLATGPGIQSGHTTDAFALNADFAPTFLELAGLPVPADMQGRSLVPVLKGVPPKDWRKSMYYRYYHDPGHHNTRAHYGVRTTTHKLIHYWKKDAWELFDLQADPGEQRNLHGQPGMEKLTENLKAELARLRRELKDDDQFAHELPKEDSGGGPLQWAEGYGPQGPKVPRP